jgi:hypothetical protein
MDRASFDLLFRPEILVVVSRQAASAALVSSTNRTPNNRIARLVLLTSQVGLSITDGGSRVGFLRLFHRLCAGQDALGENSNLYKFISVVIPIAFADVVRLQGQSNCVRLFLLPFARHAINLAKEFEHDVQRNSASGTRFNFGA